MFVCTDKYQKTRARNGACYWRFNVYVQDGEFGFISLGWRYQNGKTQAPYEIVSGKFYTNFRVSRKIAEAIYRDVIQKVGELEGREIPFDDKMWRAPIIGQSSFQKTLPSYWVDKYGFIDMDRKQKVDPEIEMEPSEAQAYLNSVGEDLGGEEVPHDQVPKDEEGEIVTPITFPPKPVAPAPERLKHLLEITAMYERKPN